MKKGYRTVVGARVRSRSGPFPDGAPGPGDACFQRQISVEELLPSHAAGSGNTLAEMQTSLPHAKGFHGLAMPSA